MRRLAPVGAMLALALMLAGCVAPTAGPTGPGGSGLTGDTHVPPFARWPYQPFSREAAVQIAYREWRAFGQPVVYPRTELPYDNERAEGLWQRVGEYWGLGLPVGGRDQGLTCLHDQNRRVSAGEEHGNSPSPPALLAYAQ